MNDNEPNDAKGQARDSSKKSQCFAEMGHVIDEVAQMIRTAPLTEKDRVSLAVTCVGKLLGYSVILFQKENPKYASVSRSSVAKEITDKVILMLESDEAKSKR